jgi:hypothetical protein
MTIPVITDLSFWELNLFQIHCLQFTIVLNCIVEKIAGPTRKIRCHSLPSKFFYFSFFDYLYDY